MDPLENTTPWVIELKLIDGRVRVVEEQSVKKARADRLQLGVDIEAASATYKQLIRRYSQGELNVPQDVQDLVLLCQSYRLDGLQHKYRCARLVEYILHLHFMLLARGRLEDLPPIPPDITWYVHTDRSGHRGQSNG